MSRIASSPPANCFAGLDIGSTTTSLLVASGKFIRNAVTGSTELSDTQQLFRSEPVFTPFRGERIDLAALQTLVKCWLDRAALDPATVTAGGGLITGLAARATNVNEVTSFIRERFQQAVVARADDPCLESWLAFMGNTRRLTLAHPERAFINLDIGGGTTNIAWGRNGEVRRCGCYYVGARHIQVEPGTYRLRALSPFASELLTELGSPVRVGEVLSPRALSEVLDFYVQLLESVVTGKEGPAPAAIARGHCQVEFRAPNEQLVPRPEGAIVTLSGGVGELAYQCARGEPLPATTTFGDLGIDLAKHLCRSPILGRDLTTFVPEGLGRATVCGLAIHGTEISGATVFLPSPELLPLSDVPILGAISAKSTEGDIAALVSLAARSTTGAGLQIRGEFTAMAAIRTMGERLASALETARFPVATPLALFVEGNVGKTLGQYATRWGRLPVALIVLDELPPRPAHFASIGRPCQNLIPVAFHGWGASLDDFLPGS